MPPVTPNLAEAIDAAATGDIWLFRGPTLADRAIRFTTNSPVNHVAMAVALDDLPPLLWHTELGRGATDVWTADRHRGAQLNRMDEALELWTGRYRQRAYVRQLDAHVDRAMENRLLHVVADYSGAAFPGPLVLARTWLIGRLRRTASLHAVFCAQLLAITYERMGLLADDRPANWYDPGRFWSGDRLRLERGAVLGPEVSIEP
ncbi:MAG: hypothetical protein S0880_19100 [Actinomycetota bacterium]|nr:hypothetical protein [Actinomycetota bacterium]